MVLLAMCLAEEDERHDQEKISLEVNVDGWAVVDRMSCRGKRPWLVSDVVENEGPRM